MTKLTFNLAMVFILSHANFSLSQNLVRNYSFENTDIPGWLNSGLADITTGLQDGRFDNNPDSFPDLNTYEKIVQYWSYCNYWTVPNRRYVWCGFPGEDPIGTPDITYEPLTANDAAQSEYQRYYSGEVCLYTGTGGGGEFVVFEPYPSIQNGHYYYIEVFIGTDDDSPGQEGRVDMFTQKPHVCSVNEEFITAYGGNGPYQNALTCYFPGINADSLGWTRYRGYFVANQDFSWISVGSPNSLYWDDIKIYEVDEFMCKEVWYFDNTVFNYPLEIFQAGDFIKAGTGVDPEAGQLDGPVTVLAGSHTRFTAGNSIELLPGFSVEYGAIFETDTVPCQQLCSPFILPDLTRDCVSGPTSIGVPDFSGTYTDLDWSPATYLDNPDSINPTFTPPSGQSGSITYTVTYTNSCPLGGTFPFPNNFTFYVTVNYIDPALVPVAPTVNYSGLVYDDQELSVQINVNNATSQIEVVAYDSNGELNFVKDYDKGIDFTGNTLNLSVGNDHQLFWSNCLDYHFVINAKNLCGEQTATVEFDWLKTWDPGTPISATLPNVITPQDGDGVNDYYCFDHFGADYYELKIYYENIGEQGPKVYEETGIITEQPTFCTNFDGHADNGNLLNEDAYLAQLSLFNHCGAELLMPNSLFYLVLPEGKMVQQDTTSFAAIPINDFEKNEIEVILTTNGNTISLKAEHEMDGEIMITDVLGSVVFVGGFNNTFSYELASGIYYVFIKSKNEILVKKKVVIL